MFFIGLICLSLTACNKKEEVNDNGNDNMVNPWVEVKTLEEAKEKTGFDLVVPDVIDGKTISLIQAKDNEMIEVRYGDDIIIRKSKGSDDNSGDFNRYDTTKQETVGSYELTVKGNGDAYNNIIWTSNDYSYSITSSNGLSLDMISEVVNSIK